MSPLPSAPDTFKGYSGAWVRSLYSAVAKGKAAPRVVYSPTPYFDYAKHEIGLPAMPLAKGQDPKLDAFFRAFMFHEFAEAEMSDWNQRPETYGLAVGGGPEAQGFLNSLNDRRIDKRQAITFPGYAADVTAALSDQYDRDVQGVSRADLSDPKMALLALGSMARHVGFSRDSWDEVLTDLPALRPTYEKARDLLEAPTLDESLGVYDGDQASRDKFAALALNMYRRLVGEPPPPQQPPPKGRQGSKAEQAEARRQARQRAKAEAAKGQGKGQGQGQGKGQGKKGDGKGEPGEGADKKPSPGVGGGMGDGLPDGFTLQDLASGDDWADRLMEALGELPPSQAETPGQATEYEHFLSTSQDFWGPLVQSAPKHKELARSLRAALADVLKAEGMERVTRQAKGAFDPRQLGGLLGGRENVLRRTRRTPESGRPIVCLAFDCSGSMANEYSLRALCTSYNAWMDALMGLGCPVAVGTWDWGVHLTRRPHDLSKPDFVRDYGRGFHSGGTNAPMAIDYFADVVRAYRKPGQPGVLVLFTDGASDDMSGIRPACEQAKADGINVLPILFGTSMRHMLGSYPGGIVCETPDSLAGQGGRAIAKAVRSVAVKAQKQAEREARKSARRPMSRAKAGV